MTQWKELNNEGVKLLQDGDVVGALAALEAAYRETTVDNRAATLVNLAAAVDLNGDPERAVQLLTEAVDLADEELRAIVVALLVNALVARALALAADGRFAEADAKAWTALDFAYEECPHLAASVHTVLAEIAGSTGDLAQSAEHFGLARDLSAATGDTASEATALLSLARLAYLSSDNDRADTLYEEAEQLLAGDPRGLAVCLHGRAAVQVSRNQPREALRLLDQVLDALATPIERVATYQVQGGALETLGEFAQADERYDAAMTVSAQAGLWHVALGIAWWRADALVRWASTVTGERRHELSRRALDLALPAALAAEAARHRFAHGALRERWVALAAAPATRAAFTAIAAVGDVELAAAYIDHVTGTVSLDAAEVSSLARDELLSLPEPPVSDFALPPRVRLDPAVPSTLDIWIDVTEQRYGFPVRSAQAVASW